MVFKIRRKKAKGPTVQVIQNQKSPNPDDEPEFSARNFVKDALTAAQPKAKQKIRAIIKKSKRKKKKKKGTEDQNIPGLILDSPGSPEDKRTTRDEDRVDPPTKPNHRSIARIMIKPGNIISGKKKSSKPPLLPSTDRYTPRKQDHHGRTPEAGSTRNSSVVSSNDSVYKLMMQELKVDFSDSKIDKRVPYKYVNAQTVVSGNRAVDHNEYEKDLDEALRVLDEELAAEHDFRHQIDSREDSPFCRPLPDMTESRDDVNMIDEPREIIEIPESDHDIDDNDAPKVPLDQMDGSSHQKDFEVQLDCAPEGSQGRLGSSVGSTGEGTNRESELVSLRDLQQQSRQNRKGKKEEPGESIAASSSYSDDGTEWTETETLRKIAKNRRRRNRLRLSSDRSEYSESTFDDATYSIGDSEYEWKNINSFDSWLSFENELRNAEKDDWLCGCLR